MLTPFRQGAGEGRQVASSNSEFVAFVVDQMQGVGPVYAKRMFGGAGLFVDDLMIALIAANSLYLKVDSQSRTLFESQGLQPFTFDRKGKPVAMSYFQAPEEVLEDVEAMNRWGNEAYAAALRLARKR